MRLQTLAIAVLVTALAAMSVHAGGDDAYEAPNFGGLIQREVQQHPVVAPRTSPPRRTGAPGRIVFLGDSLTRGPGIARTEAYPALIQKKLDAAGLPYVTFNVGVNGITSGGSLSRLPTVLTSPAAVVVVALGTNDANQLFQKGRDRAKETKPACDRLAANLEKIVKLAQAKGSRVVLVGLRLPRWYGSAMVDGFNAAFKSVSERCRVPLAPALLEGVWGDGKLWLNNGHPNAKGHQVMAANVWKVLEPALRDFGAGR